MPDKKTGVVFDCNIYVQALISDLSAAAKCFEMARDDTINLFISDSTFAELIEVLSRPKILGLLSGCGPNRIQTFLEEVLAVSIMVNNCLRKFSFSRDPDDEPYINLAIAADADYIVSRDKDLLNLMTGHTDEAKEFRQKFRHLKVVEPVEFLRIVRDIDLALNP